MKYKATERYSMGWTDPKGVFGGTAASGWLSHASSLSSTEADKVDLDVLLNLWIAKFGSDRVYGRTILYSEEVHFWVRATNRLIAGGALVAGPRDEWFEVK